MTKSVKNLLSKLKKTEPTSIFIGRLMENV